MSKVYTSVTELIGRTPLIELVNIEKKYDLKAKVVAKLELFNPAGSVKDRVARAMVEDAEKSGKLKKGSTIIEPTSGNTGIGLASVATAKGYKTILTMPETMSVERRNLLKAYGAEIVLTDGTKGMSGAIAKAKELEKEIDGGIILGQFENPANLRLILIQRVRKSGRIRTAMLISSLQVSAQAVHSAVWVTFSSQRRLM